MLHVALFFLASLPLARALPAPPGLSSEDGCSVWTGTATGGNDRAVDVMMKLCEAPEGTVRGEYQWSSPTSGWNIRAMEGKRTGNRFEMRDTRFIEQAAEPGWRFCLSERYELTLKTPEHLVGHYENRGCQDRADLDLRRTSSHGSTSSAAPGPTSPSPVPDLPASDPVEPAGGGALCSILSGGSAAFSSLLLLALGMRRRRTPH